MKRAQQIRNAVKAAGPNGGTTAPRPRGYSVSNNSPLNFNPQQPNVNRFSPKGESKNTKYAKGGGSAISTAGAEGGPALPWDSIATLEGGQAGRTLERGQAGVGSERVLAEQGFGLAEGYNVNNAYSQAALLEAQHTAQHRGIVNSAGNQLYAGATLNRAHGSDKRYAMNLSGLAGQRAAKLAELEGEENANTEGYGEAQTKAQIGAIERAENAPLEKLAGKAKKKKPKPQPLGKLPFYAKPSDLPYKKKGKK